MKKDKEYLDSLPLEEKIRMVEQMIVIHPQMQRILDKMDYCRLHAKRALEAVGLLVTGEKGTGKTTIKDIYLKKNARKQTPTGTFIPVYSIYVPVPATVKGLTNALLKVLNDSFPDKGTVIVQTARVCELIEKCAVEIGIFDEFQHFAERESFKLNRTVSDWTKNFMNETKKPLVLFGTPKSAEILNGTENDQLRRRFPFKMHLKPFGWDTKSEQREFRKFLRMIDDLLPLLETSNLADPDVAYRIHYATGGLIYEIMRLLRAAGVMALERNCPRINLSLLAESFEENLATNSPEISNPFKSQ